MSRTIPVCCLLFGTSVGLADDAAPITLPEPLALAPPTVAAEAPTVEPIGPVAASSESRRGTAAGETAPVDAVLSHPRLVPTASRAPSGPFFSSADAAAGPASIPVPAPTRAAGLQWPGAAASRDPAQRPAIGEPGFDSPLFLFVPGELATDEESPRRTRAIVREEPALLVQPSPEELHPIPQPDPLPLVSDLIRVADSVHASEPPASQPPARVRIWDRADTGDLVPPRSSSPTIEIAPLPFRPTIPALIRPTSFWPMCDALPVTPVVCPSNETEECNGRPTEASRLAHLLEAARHFEAAGRPELATAIRKEVGVSRRLAEKQRQLAVLRKEIEELRSLDRRANFVRESPRQVMIGMTILEVGEKSTTKKAGRLNSGHVDRPKPSAAVETVSHDASVERSLPGTGWIEADARSLAALVDLLRAQPAAKVISRPTIRTVDGREATVQMGGEFPIPVPNAAGEFDTEFREFGTKATVIPTIGEDDQIRVDLTAEISERDFAQSVTLNGVDVPGLNVRRFRTTAEIAPGRSLLVWGPSKEGVTPFFLLSPEIVEPQTPVAE